MLQTPRQYILLLQYVEEISGTQILKIHTSSGKVVRKVSKQWYQRQRAET